MLGSLSQFRLYGSRAGVLQPSVTIQSVFGYPVDSKHEFPILTKMENESRSGKHSHRPLNPWKGLLDST